MDLSFQPTYKVLSVFELPKSQPSLVVPYPRHYLRKFGFLKAVLPLGSPNSRTVLLCVGIYKAVSTAELYDLCHIHVDQ